GKPTHGMSTKPSADPCGGSAAWMGRPRAPAALISLAHGLAQHHLLAAAHPSSMSRRSLVFACCVVALVGSGCPGEAIDEERAITLTIRVPPETEAVIVGERDAE